MAILESEEAEKSQNTTGLTFKIVTGSLWSLIGQISVFLFSMILTPVIINKLGKEGYGVLVLINLLPVYLAFSDFGMGNASTKFASEAFAENSQSKESEIIWTTACIAFSGSFFVALLLFIFSSTLVNFLEMPENLHYQINICFKLVSLIIIFRNLNLVMNTPQLVRFRMDLNTAVNSGGVILQSIAIIIVLLLGGKLIAVTLTITVVSLLVLICNFTFSYKLLPGLLNFSIDRKIFKKLINFGGALVLSSIAAALLVNSEKFVLAKLADVVSLAHYSAAFALSSIVTTFSGAMVQALLPAFSQLNSAENREKVNNLYSRGIKLNLLWAIPCFVAMTIFAKPFFIVWAGEDFGRESPYPFYILLIGLLFNILAYFPSSVIMASGKTKIFAKLYWTELVPYLLLVTVLTYLYGIKGAAVSWSIRSVVDAIIIFYLAKKFANISLTINYRNILMLLLTSFFFIPCLILAIHSETNIIIVAAAYFFSFLLFLVSVWLKVVENEEKKWIVDISKNVFKRI